MSFNLLDVVFLVLIGGLTVLSFKRGALREIMGLLGIAVGFFAANWYAPSVAEVMRPLLPEGNASELLGFILFMMAGYFLGQFLGGFSQFLMWSPKGIIFRLVASVIGFGKGLVFSLALYWVIQAYVPPFHDELAASWVGDLLGQVIQHMKNLKLI